MKYKVPFRFNSHERKGIFLLLLVLFVLFYVKVEVVRILALTQARFTVQVLQLNSQPKTTPKHPKTSNFPTASKQAQVELQPSKTIKSVLRLGEINSADTSQLKRIHGIGSVYSNRIVKFRKRLGGFVDMEQLGAVYGLNENLVDSIKKYFTLDASKAKKIKLTDANAYDLRRYPFLSEMLIEEYVLFRTKSGLNSQDSLTNFFKKRLNKYDFYLLYLYTKTE